MYTTDKTAFVSKETGEVYAEFNAGTKVYIRTKEQDKAYQEITVKKQNDFLFKEFQKIELGGFIFMIYNNIQLLTEQLEIQIQDIPKLMYLSSYLNYDNILMINNKRTMSKQDMQDILKLARPAFSKFFKLLIEKEILTEEKTGKDKIYKLNDKIFKKGEVDTTSMKTKMYINSIRYLYENTSIRMHSNLAVAYQLIPYAHKELNILCQNPFTDDRSQIKPFTIHDICKTIGVNTEGSNAKNITRVKKQLYSLTLEDGTRVIRSYKVDMNKIDKWVLNPKVVSNFVTYDSYSNFNNTFDLLFHENIADYKEL